MGTVAVVCAKSPLCPCRCGEVVRLLEAALLGSTFDGWVSFAPVDGRRGLLVIGPPCRCLCHAAASGCELASMQRKGGAGAGKGGGRGGVGGVGRGGGGVGGRGGGRTAIPVVWNGVPYPSKNKAREAGMGKPAPSLFAAPPQLAQPPQPPGQPMPPMQPPPPYYPSPYHHGFHQAAPLMQQQPPQPPQPPQQRPAVNPHFQIPAGGMPAKVPAEVKKWSDLNKTPSGQKKCWDFFNHGACARNDRCAFSHTM